MRKTKVQKGTAKFFAKYERMTPVYLVGCWARFGVMEFKWSGKWGKDFEGRPVPMVWHYNDHNGRADQYEEIPIYETTTGTIYGWTFSKWEAEKFAKLLQDEDDAARAEYDKAMKKKAAAEKKAKKDLPEVGKS